MVFISPYLTDAEMRNSLNSYAKLLNDQEQSLRSHEEVVSQKAEQLEKREKAISAKEGELKRREALLAAREKNRRPEAGRAESVVPRASAPPASRQPPKQNLPPTQPGSSHLTIPLKRTQNFREMATAVGHSLGVDFDVDGIEVVVEEGGNKERANTGGGGAGPFARKSVGVGKPSAPEPKKTKKDSKKQSVKGDNGTGEGKRKRNIGPFNRYLNQNKDRLREEARRRGGLGPGSVTQVGAEEWRQIKDKSPWMATASADLGEGNEE